MRASRSASSPPSRPLKNRCSSRCGSCFSRHEKSAKPTPTTSRIETCRRCSVGLSSTPMPFSSWKASTSLRWSAYDQGQSRQNSSRVDNERMGRAWN